MIRIAVCDDGLGKKKRQNRTEGGTKLESSDVVATSEEGKNLQVLVQKDIQQDASLSGNRALFSFSMKSTTRSPVSSLSLVLFAGIFVFALLWMNHLVIRNHKLIDQAYDETLIGGEVRSTTAGYNLEGIKSSHIPGSHITALRKTGLLKNYHAIEEMDYNELFFKEKEEKYSMSQSKRMIEVLLMSAH